MQGLWDMMGQSHLGFGNQMSGAMDRMYEIQRANANAVGHGPAPAAPAAPQITPGQQMAQDQYHGQQQLHQARDMGELQNQLLRSRLNMLMAINPSQQSRGSTWGGMFNGSY